MGIKFEVEANFKIKKGKKIEYFIIAKCLEMGAGFSITDNSKLDEIEIRNYLNQPRAIDEEGKPRLDIFAFRIRHKADFNAFKEGQIVELTHDEMQ